MSKIILAPDKFKHTLSATEICRIETEEILKLIPEAEVVSFPMADGGEGTLDLLTSTIGLDQVMVEVSDPLFRPIMGRYGISKDGQNAYIEMALASGLDLLSPQERNPMLTSSFGTGQLIAHAMDAGVQKVHLFIGGSATNEGGMGMASALGFRFYDEQGRQLTGSGQELSRVHSWDGDGVHHRLPHTQFVVATDVKNILLGEQGATYTFGAQKGGSIDQLRLLEEGMVNFAEQSTRQMEQSYASVPGAGAAGGLGYGALAFLGAEIRSGIDLLIEVTGLADALVETQLIISGEGNLDEQSTQGKVVDGIGRLAKSKNVPFGVICGGLELSDEQLSAANISLHKSLVEVSGSLEAALKEPERYLRQATRQFILDWLQ